MQFSKAVRAQVGRCQTDYFMSDCAKQYFNALCSVFGCENTKQLLCIWHVDRAWRSALNEHTIYWQATEGRNLSSPSRFITKERGKQIYSPVATDNVFHNWDVAYSFFKYFNTIYVSHVKQWGTCYRVGTVVNTNMFTESFLQLLRVVCLNNKQNRRVNWLIHILLWIARNLVYEQLQKV